MADTKWIDRIPMYKVTHSVRATDAVCQYGPGAMVDFPTQTLMTAKPEFWEKATVPIHDERLEKVMKVREFRMPTSGAKGNIAYVRFPEWYFCPKCRRFRPLSDWITEDKTKKADKTGYKYMTSALKCPSCHVQLVVSRLITACSHGHISDFPWLEWVHAKNRPSVPICAKPLLLLKSSASSGQGLESIALECKTCGAYATLAGAYGKESLSKVSDATGGRYDFSCKGKHPWKHVTEKCDAFPRVLQRGASSVYFPTTVSSLVIPPYSDRLTHAIEDSSEYERIPSYEDLQEEASLHEMEVREYITKHLPLWARRISDEITESEDDVKKILQRKLLPDDSNIDSVSKLQYRMEEYDALNMSKPVSDPKGNDFMCEATIRSEYGDIPYLKQIVLIHKVREIRALIGFSRINPFEQDAYDIDNNEKASDLVSTKEKDWFPAIETRGEGIFIEFDSAAIQEWLAIHPDAVDRARMLNTNYSKSFMSQRIPRTISAKYLMLHTLSHLLIRQLSFECGYSIASLKERIYCSEIGDGKVMAGILIYTASGDALGTLGGLVRQGRPDTFPALFRKALHTAEVCSNDPVCNMSRGQGRDSTNLAACHSCTLIPETSCEDYNIFLDRVILIGKMNNRGCGIFSQFTYGIDITPRKAIDIQAQKVLYSVSDEGTDMSEQSYRDIWDDLLGWSDNEHEREVLKQLMDSASMTGINDKPCRDTVFEVDGLGKCSCDLYWKGRNLAVFTMDKRDEMPLLARTAIQCLCLADPDTTVDLILKKLGV